MGVLAPSLVLALTLGSAWGGESSFLANLAQVDVGHIVHALLGGALFNVANLLLVAAIDIAGLAVAFPMGIGLALVVGVLSNYVLAPRGNPLLLFGGVALIVLAIVFDALAYRAREAKRREVGRKGIAISLACGVLMGMFYPLVTEAITGRHALGPYTVGVAFALGVLLCALPLNYFFMRRPIVGGDPASMKEYLAGKTAFHWFGILGGCIWCLGMVLNIVASHAQLVGPAVSYAIGQGATLVSAIWGVLIWREFAEAPIRARRFLPPMFFCFVVGLGAVAVAPIVAP